MRNVIFGINLTLDGCCDHTTQFADEETHEYWTDILREAGLLVYGRKTYELMVLSGLTWQKRSRRQKR